MGRMRVLVVDDDAAVRRSLSTALGRDGYEVLAVDGGGAALAHTASRSVVDSTAAHPQRESANTAACYAGPAG